MSAKENKETACYIVSMVTGTIVGEQFNRAVNGLIYRYEKWRHENNCDITLYAWYLHHEDMNNIFNDFEGIDL